MDIWRAQCHDADMVAGLLSYLGYPAKPTLAGARLRALGDADYVLVTDGGLIDVHRISPLAEGGTSGGSPPWSLPQRKCGIACALLAIAQNNRPPLGLPPAGSL